MNAIFSPRIQLKTCSGMSHLFSRVVNLSPIKLTQYGNMTMSQYFSATGFK